MRTRYVAVVVESDENGKTRVRWKGVCEAEGSTVRQAFVAFANKIKTLRTIEIKKALE